MSAVASAPKELAFILLGWNQLLSVIFPVNHLRHNINVILEAPISTVFFSNISLKMYSGIIL
ncbi:MAG: hypothetical protein M3Y53_07360 [Thermoproteota archaeon]|nr:hypothetical protein [Thermoproteota archaeon]